MTGVNGRDSIRAKGSMMADGKFKRILDAIFVKNTVLAISYCLLVACGHADTISLMVSDRPIPEEYGVSFSSPDAEGKIIIAGYQAVRPKVVVVAKVEGATTGILDATARKFARLGESLKSAVKSMLPTAYADNPCLSDFPVCPNTTRNGICQFEADSNGSFMLKTTASVGSEITLNYVNAFNCGQMTVFAGARVGADTPFVEMHAYDMTAADNRVYVVGQSNNFAPVMSILDVQTKELVTTYTVDDISTPQDIELFDDQDDVEYMFLSGLGGAIIGPRNDPDDFDSAGFYELVQPSGAEFSGLRFAASVQFYDDDSLTCSGLSPASGSYDRVLMYNDAGLYFYEFSGSYLSAGPGVVSNGTLIAEELDLKFRDANNSAYSIESIPFVTVLEDPVGIEDILVIVAEISSSGLAPTFYLFQYDITTENLCDGITIMREDGLAIGSDASGISVSMLNEGIGVYGSLSALVAVLKKDSQQVSLIELYGTANTINYDLYSDNKVATNGDITYDLALKKPASAVVTLTRPDDGIEELFVLGEFLGGSDFLISYTNVESDYETVLPQYAFVPQSFFYDSDMNPFIILDSTLSGITGTKGYSFLRFYDLTPSGGTEEVTE